MVLSTVSERPSDRIQEWRARVFRTTGSNERPLAAPLSQPRGHAHDPLWTCHGIDLDYGPRVRLFFKWARWRFQDRDWTHRPKAELIRFVEQLLELGLNDLPESHNDMVRNTDDDGEVKRCELHGRPPSTIGVSAETDSTIYIPPLAPAAEAPPAAGPSAQGPAPAGSVPDPSAHGQPDENGAGAELDGTEELDELEEEGYAGVGGAQAGADVGLNEREGGEAEGGAADGNDRGHGFVADKDDDIDSIDSTSSGESSENGGEAKTYEGNAGDDVDEHGEQDGQGKHDEHGEQGAGEADEAVGEQGGQGAHGGYSQGSAGDALDGHGGSGGHGGHCAGEEDDPHGEDGGDAEMNSRSSIGDGAPPGADAAEAAEGSHVAESVHRFSPSLGPSTRSSSVVWIPNPQDQLEPPALAPPSRSREPAGPVFVAASDSAGPRAPAVPYENNPRPPTTPALLGAGSPDHPRGAIAARALDNAPLAGPSRPSASAAGLSSAFGFRLPPPDVSSSPPPFRSIPSANSLRRNGVTTYFGRPASFSQLPSASHRPQTPLRDTQAPTGPPLRKRAKKTRGAPLKQNSGQSFD